MPNIDDVFTTKYLKAYDLQGREPVVTIAQVELEPMGRTRELKVIVYFEGKTKGLKLNKTMALKIAQIAGSSQTEQWVGTAVQLYVSTADFGGENYDVIRVKAPTAAAELTQRVSVPAHQGGGRPVTPAPRKPVAVAATGTDMLRADEIFARGPTRRPARPAAEDEDDVPF